MGYWLWNTHTHSRSLRLSRDVTFDESSSHFLQGEESRPVPGSPALSSVQAPVIECSAPAAPNTAALPPIFPVHAPSRDYSTDSEASVIRLLWSEFDRPFERLETLSFPLFTLTPLLSTPERPSATLRTPPRRCIATCMVDRPPASLPDPTEGHASRVQRGH